MGDVVLKPFSTLNRRLNPGDQVSVDDDFSPHSFEWLKERGFIGSKAQPSLWRFAKAAAMKGDDE